MSKIARGTVRDVVPNFLENENLPNFRAELSRNHIRNFARSVEDLQYTLAEFVPVIVDCLDSL